MKEKKAIHGHIKKHRDNLLDLTRMSYGFLRLIIVIYGTALALGYILSPLVGKILVPIFAVHIFIPVLGVLWFAETVLRMTEYSYEAYPNKTICDEDECLKEEKKPAMFRIAFFIFPFKGIHLSLLGTWVFIALYYLVFFALGTYGGYDVVLPDNFSLSFYVISGACALDYLAKAAFIFMIPEIGEFVTLLAETAVETERRFLPRFMKAFLRLFFRG